MKYKSIYTDLIAIDCKNIVKNFLATGCYADGIIRISREIYDIFRGDTDEDEDEDDGICLSKML